MIIVTGAAGFIGSNFINLLNLKTSEEILVIDNLTYASDLSYLDGIDFTFVEGSISDDEALDHVFDRYRREVSYIVNFAAESHVDRSIVDCMPFIETNIIGTVKLLNKALNCPNLIKFVQVSTDEVFGQLLDDGTHFTELTPIAPRNPYSASKASAEHFVNAFAQTYGLPCVIVNSSNNYGPHQHIEKLIPSTITKAINNQPIPVYGKGEQIRDWIYVEDCCEAIFTVMQKGTLNERYCIGGENEVKNIQLVKNLLKLLDKPDGLLTFVPDRLGHDFRYSTDISKIKTLGWYPKIDLVTGLELTIDWYRTRTN